MLEGRRKKASPLSLRDTQALCKQAPGNSPQFPKTPLVIRYF
jgi:hypothetical protein